MAGPSFDDEDGILFTDEGQDVVKEIVSPINNPKRLQKQFS